MRTVHHVDDFTSAVLMDCQRQAILEPDVVLTVSEYWRDVLAADYGVRARVVRNGVDVARFAGVPPGRARATTGPGGSPGRPGPAAAAVGRRDRAAQGQHPSRPGAGPEPPGRLPVPPVLAVLGGHSFQDHRPYRDAVLAELPGLGLTLGRDVVELGTVPDAEMPGWYAAADALAFPSTKEGFGLAVLEAMSAGLPVVTSDLPAFQEYLRGGVDVLMVPVGDETALAEALVAVLDDSAVAGLCRAAGDPGVRPLHLGPVRGRAPADLRREVAMISCMSWLVPAAGPVRDRLAGVIAGLAAEHGAPVFAPHVTMAGVAEAEPTRRRGCWSGWWPGCRRSR